MKVLTLLRGALTAAAAMTLFACASDPRRCCDSLSPTEDAGISFNAHKEAILRFVRGGKDPGEREGRLARFQGVLKTLEPLGDSDAIHDRLSRFETTHPEFWGDYDKLHF